jgi:EmrB/QacA subfamily drug resistance transporter
LSILFLATTYEESLTFSESPIQAHRYKLFTVGAIGTFMATLDGSIVNVALPTISRSFDVSVDLVSWVVLAYSLTLISLMLVYGAWVERKGYFFAYRFGYSLFMIGSLICSLAPSIYVLFLGRVVQAAGTAMFAAVGPGMITTVFPKEERGKGLGLMVMMVSLGFMAGPTLGGLMLGVWTWHSIFVINLPIGAVGLYMTFRYFRLLPEAARTDKPFRPYGAIVLSLSLVAVVFALKMVNTWSISDTRVWLLAGLAMAGFLAFLKIESYPEYALIGLKIFRNRQFTTAIAAQQMQFVGLTGVLILGPFYLERVKDMEPKQVGLCLVILPILMFIVAPLSGWLSDRIGYRILTSLGMIEVGIGLFLVSRFGVATSVPYIVMSLVVVGFGVGTFSTPNTSAVMGSVAPEQRAVTSSILATNRNIGQSMGVALATTLFAYFEAQQSYLASEKLTFIAGFRPPVHVAMVFVGIGFLLCLTRKNRLE